MKISANSIRQGNILVYKNKLWRVAKQPDHTKPGKGGAYVQVELKDIKTGTKLNERFSSTDMVDKAHLDKKPYQFLYFEEGNIVLMDLESFEQLYLSKEFLGEKSAYLADGMQVEVEFFEDEALSIELPNTVIAKVVETEPHIKGATVTSSFKPAILENGIKVMVPPYLSVDEMIVVKTEDDSFVERAK